MAKKKDPDAIDRDQAQPALVPMSADELKAAGRTLATKIRELEEMEQEHAEERKDRKEERDALRKQIASMASACLFRSRSVTLRRTSM